MSEIEKLPSNTKSLKHLISSLYTEIDKRDKELNFYKIENENLSDLVRLLRRQRFAPRSEVISSEQLHIFNEAEADAKEYPEVEEEKATIKSYKRGKPKRKPLPENLPREVVVIEIPENERKCPHDGIIMEVIGQEISEQLDIIPAQIKVIQTVRLKYACKACEGSIKTAPVPAKPIPKGIATAGLLAFIATSKYADGLPLYRIENIFQRNKIDISRGTMAHWMIKIGELFAPIYNLMDEDLLSGKYICCDETRVQVLKEENKKPTTQSYMWVRGRDGPKRIILFEYDPTRKGDVPVRLLPGYKGYLQVDGYIGYDKVCKNSHVIRVGCWSHVRRKFFEAFKASKHGKGKSEEALKFIKTLYKIEEKIKDFTIEEKYSLRQLESKPTINEIRTWLDKYLHDVPPKSILGKAIQYTHNEWPNLVRYLENGELRIDNNFVENAIRPFAIGRKNWLFSDTVDGARASAMIYSMIESAKANGHEPYSYLRLILESIPRAKTLDDIEKLLPYNLPPINLFQEGVA